MLYLMFLGTNARMTGIMWSHCELISGTLTANFTTYNIMSLLSGNDLTEKHYCNKA